MRRLILRPGAIGDCILSLPAIEHLRAEYTEIWAPSPILPLMQFAEATQPIVSTGLDLVGVGDLPTPTHLRERLESFDSIVSWYGANRPEFRHAMLQMNKQCEFHPALPHDFSMHATDFVALQVGAPLGLTPRISVPQTTRGNMIVVHPFSGSKKKNWPLEYFRELAARLPLEVNWLTGPEEDLPGAHRFESLVDVARFIASARMYIGNDSGITHLAAAVGVTTLAIFGPASPKIWVPRGENVEVVAVSDLAELKIGFVSRIVNRLLGSP